MKRKTIFTTLIIAIVLFASLQTVMALPQCPNLGRTLSLGMRGQDVSQLQIYLNSYLGLGLNTQGIFGNLTKKVVQTFQRQQNIRPVNGVVGTITKNAIANNCSNDSTPVDETAPANCKVWYDGCNTCSRQTPGGPLMCTMMACFAHNTPYCKEYFNGSNSGSGTINGTVTGGATSSPVFCTQDARQCPNGKWVGRTGPNCQFVCN
jgi:peptidoglycan hydrolase-like protein with peptidoglycan-binding domain